MQVGTIRKQTEDAKHIFFCCRSTSRYLLLTHSFFLCSWTKNVFSPFCQLNHCAKHKLFYIHIHLLYLRLILFLSFFGCIFLFTSIYYLVFHFNSLILKYYIYQSGSILVNIHWWTKLPYLLSSFSYFFPSFASLHFLH